MRYVLETHELQRGDVVRPIGSARTREPLTIWNISKARDSVSGALAIQFYSSEPASKNPAVCYGPHELFILEHRPLPPGKTMAALEDEIIPLLLDAPKQYWEFLRSRIQTSRAECQRNFAETCSKLLPLLVVYAMNQKKE